MSLSVGQYIKNNNHDYITQLTSPSNGAKEAGLLKYPINLTVNQVYYLKINTKNLSGKVKLVLQTRDNEQQVIMISNIQSGNVLETIFTVKFTNITHLLIMADGIELNKIDDINLYSVINILSSYIAKASLKRIGVQASPNQLICINGNPLCVNHSGIFELSDPDINIYFLGMIATSYSDKFIIDYQY